VNPRVKWLGIAVAALALIGASGVGYLLVAFPKVGPAPNQAVQSSPELLERGRYLATHVSGCIDCHSERDWQRFSGPIVPGTEGKGGLRFGRENGMPGTIFAKNITPAALGNWSDGELVRAFTAGVSRDGSALFPVMPYPSYSAMCERDAHAIVVYLRSLRPIENAVLPSALGFPMNLIARTIPAEANPGPCPGPANAVALGAYLAKIAGCAECHTPKNHGKPLPGMDFAGGFAFEGMPNGGGTVRSSNITPDVGTGIGGWKKEDFVQRFRAFGNPNALVAVKPGAFNTVMPWTIYAGMSDGDLSAIYEYLRTVPPVNNRVERWQGP
jgi:mono/diheme cytochrome c family protein